MQKQERKGHKPRIEPVINESENSKNARVVAEK
jgi:hypothetical protein